MSVKEKKKKVISYIVDNVDTQFRVNISSDDGGAHLCVYLPEEVKQDLNLDNFRKGIYKFMEKTRVTFFYVHDSWF